MNLLQKIIRFLIQEKRVASDQSYMVTLYPSDNTALNILEYREDLKDKYNFDGMRELNPEELHATIRWWKPANGGKNIKGMIKKLETIPFEMAQAEIKNLQPLGDSLSIMLESPEMQTIFSIVDQVVRSFGAPPSDYPNYLPHIALFYDDSFQEGFDLDGDLELPSFPFIFDRICLVDKDDKIYFEKWLD